ncbi:MAG: hypothetical protein COA49_04980 [Bacteroidetes bacterium]|nr:MAG: hypothetical protein COA49_04980 [Bacteroidota bacterium]
MFGKSSNSSILNFIGRRFDDVVISGNAVAIRLRRELVGATPQQIRIAIEGMSRLNPGRFGGNLEYREIEGIRCGVVDFHGIKDHGKRVIWAHGGAFSFGSARVYKAAAIFLAKALKCEVIIPEYRLAPEHPYPAAIEDLFKVYSSIRKSESGLIFLIGDSAGGNLASCLVSKLLQENREVPDKLVLLSPWMDLSKKSQSNIKNSSDFSPFDNLDTVAFSREYIGEMDDKDPLVSPVFGSFKGFPPTHIQGSYVEFLYSDAESTLKAMNSDDVVTTVHWETKALHGWHLLPDILPEAKRSLQEVANFLMN